MLKTLILNLKLGRRVMKSKRELSYAVARGNLESIVLQALNGEPLSALGLINRINYKIGIQFSPGTIYTKLWNLETEGCVTQDKTEKKFELTDEGRARLKQNVAALLPIWSFLGETLK